MCRLCLAGDGGEQVAAAAPSKKRLNGESPYFAYSHVRSLLLNPLAGAAAKLDSVMESCRLASALQADTVGERGMSRASSFRMPFVPL